MSSRVILIHCKLRFSPPVSRHRFSPSVKWALLGKETSRRILYFPSFSSRLLKWALLKKKTSRRILNHTPKFEEIDRKFLLFKTFSSAMMRKVAEFSMRHNGDTRLLFH